MKSLSTRKSRDQVLQPENSQVVLRVPRRHNLYSFNLIEIQPERDINYLLAKASSDESTKWHRRMAHVNYKNINKLAKHGLVNGLPSKLFTNDHNCVACNKGKQHKASYKAITAVSTISEPLQLLHMDLFGPTSIRSIDHKYYSLVVTDDLSRFSWVFFLGTKDETYYILKDFITFIENQLNKKVKAIRCDNGTEFKNSKLIELCGSKGIKRDYSNARTPQQNGVAERKNRTLIEAARTMLADSKLPTMFWTEAVSTACYVLNRVLVTRPHNKTPYELLSGKVPNISHLKPFGCHVTILNTSDHLGKFEGKADEGFIVGYAAHRLGQEWYFDLDYLTNSLGYTRFKSNQPAGTQDPHIHAGTQDDSDSECDEQVIVVPSFPSNRFSGPKVHEASEMVESNSDYAEELARLQRQEHEAKDTAEKYGFGFSKDTRNFEQADMVPTGSIDHAASISAGSIDPAASISAGSAKPFPTVIEPVHADETSLPPGHSLGSSEHSTRFPSPSDLANSISSSSEMEDIYHFTRTGIFSSSSYVRVNTFILNPDLGDLTSPVQTRGTLKKSKFGESNARGDGKQFIIEVPSLYGEIDKEVYVTQPRDLRGTDRDKTLFIKKKFQAIEFMSRSMWMTLFWSIKEWPGVMNLRSMMDLYHQDKVCPGHLKKFDMESVRTATTPYEASKPKSKDELDDAVNVHLYRSMIGSLMYLTASRPDIMFAVSACSRHQIVPTGRVKVPTSRYVVPTGKDNVIVSAGRSKVIPAASDEEIEGPMKDQPLSADASPTALSPGYIANSKLKEDDEDHEEDPADYPADGGDNYDNESSDDDNDDDDVEKDKEDEEEEEHLCFDRPFCVTDVIYTILHDNHLLVCEACITECCMQYRHRLNTTRDDKSTQRVIIRGLAPRILRGTLAHRQIDLSDCSERKNRNHENQTRGAGARGAVHALRGEETNQDPNNIKNEIKCLTL
ncbi:putative ribonuclease H-like domain-containing protein [Tanacetum coccineum]